MDLSAILVYFTNCKFQAGTQHIKFQFKLWYFYVLKITQMHFFFQLKATSNLYSRHCYRLHLWHVIAEKKKGLISRVIPKDDLLWWYFSALAFLVITGLQAVPMGMSTWEVHCICSTPVPPRALYWRTWNRLWTF